MARNVETLCKTLSNYSRTIFVKLCEKLFSAFSMCKTTPFPQLLSPILTTFPTTFRSLFISILFHFSTKSITITINNLEERI